MEDETAQDKERELVAWAGELGARIGGYSAAHDREGSFVSEAYALLKEEGYFALAVPEDLGGKGATPRQVSMAQRELARHCASTALASVMHHHVTLFTAWRYRREMPGAEATLRRIADEKIVLVSTGGADFTRPRGTAEKVEGGFKVSGRKIFASSSPAGSVLSTMFPFDDPDEGRIVLNVAVPMGDGVTVLDNWDTLGMRGTGSNDVEIDGVFVPEERVMARRPYAKLDPPIQVIMAIAMPVIASVYLGVAQAARDHAVALVAGTPRADDPLVQRGIGLMDNRLRVAAWALDGAHATVGDDPAPSMDNVTAVMAAKREIVLAGIEVCDLALEVGGGASYFRSNPIEQCVRDVRGGRYHPLNPEATLLHAGTVALGLPADDF